MYVVRYDVCYGDVCVCDVCYWRLVGVSLLGFEGVVAKV